MLCPQPNASSSFLMTCINFVEQQLTFSHFEGSIIRFPDVKVSGCYFYLHMFLMNCMGFPMLPRRLMGVVSIWNVWHKTISFQLASRSRVAPYKNKKTIPRLELLGNLILSRLILTVSNSFKRETDISSLYAWSDSKVS